MRIIALAVLLAVMQATVPVPREAPDNKAGQASKDHAKTDSEKTSSTPIGPSSPSQSADTPQHQGSANPANPSNAEKTISVTELPAVTVNTDWWYRAYVMFTAALVVVGAIGVGYAVKTLKAIERQAKANEDQLTEIQQSSEKTDRMILLTAQQTENVKKSTDALINSERSWIMTELDWQDGRNRIHVTTERKGDSRVDTSRIYLVLRGKNEGRTPAWITAIKFWCTLYFEAPPAKPDIAADIAFSRLGPDPLGIGQPLIENLDLRYDGQRTQIASAVIIYGVVEYRDVFGDHETWCGYTVRGDPEHVYLERLAGYREYNNNS